MPYWTGKLQIWSFPVDFLLLYCGLPWKNTVDILVIPLADAKRFSVAEYQASVCAVKLVDAVYIHKKALMAPKECFFRERFFHIVQNGGKGTYILRPYRMNNYLMKTAFQISDLPVGDPHAFRFCTDTEAFFTFSVQMI